MKDLIPTKEVARRKGVTVKTVNLWAQQGKLPIAYQEIVSGARLFDPDVVEAFDPKHSSDAA